MSILPFVSLNKVILCLGFSNSLAIFGHSTGKRSFTVKWQKNLYRTALTALLGLVAWAGSSSLDKVVSLVGCFACIPLSFIYPAIFHSHITNNKWVKLKDWAIVVFGTLAMFYTTYITVLQWAQDHASPTNRCQSPP